MRAPGYGGAIEIALRVADQAAVRVKAVPGLSPEAIEDGFVSGRSDFEDRARVHRSTIDCGAIEIALIVHDQGRIGLNSVSGSPEVVDHRLGLGVRWLNGNQQQRGKYRQRQGEARGEGG